MNLPKSIYGIHDIHDINLYGDKKGWVLKVEAIGSDPNNMGSIDMSWWEDQGFGVICRIQHGWGDAGTIPLPEKDDDFLQRLEYFIAHSKGCHIWVLGNEMNHEQERPENQVIYPSRYASLYNKAHSLLHALYGHENDLLVVGAVAPWNATTTYLRNKQGDWVTYLYHILIGIEHLDAVSLHTYTHGVDPALITSDHKMDPPFQDRHYHFKAFEDFMQVVPNVPIFITESNCDTEWHDFNSGWVKEAYTEINRWNQSDDRQIYCLLLYCWPERPGPFDASLYDKPHVLQDFKEAVALGYERGKDMAGWNEVYVNRCEQGFYPQDGENHLMMANGLTVHYLHGGAAPNFPRPEMKPKDREAGEPEVYEGRYSQSGFYISSKGRYYIVSDRIYVETNKDVRGSVMYMHTFAQENFGMGARCGIVDGDGPFNTTDTAWPLNDDPGDDPDIYWGEWRWARQNDVNLPEREWAKLESPVTLPSEDYVRFVVQLNVDVAGAGSNGHWDVFRVEQYTQSTEPPPGGAAERLEEIGEAMISLGEEVIAISSSVDGCPDEAFLLVSGAVEDLNEALRIM